MHHEARQDALVIAGRSFESRLIVGTGKYKSVEETERAIDASGAQIVTVAVRRIDVGDRSVGSLMSLLLRRGEGLAEVGGGNGNGAGTGTGTGNAESAEASTGT